MSREWKIASHPANLREVRKELEEFAKSVGLPEKAADDVGLVLNEALANIMRHGYGGAVDRPIVVQAEQIGDQFQLVIRDWGKPFDPAAVKKKALEDVSPGGLGLICMTKLMDDVNFERLADGMLLRMTKKIEGP
jgi:anti-sigma regulatory factor (Ser/Thr protein kinase)